MKCKFRRGLPALVAIIFLTGGLAHADKYGASVDADPPASAPTVLETNGAASPPAVPDLSINAKRAYQFPFTCSASIGEQAHNGMTINTNALELVPANAQKLERTIGGYYFSAEFPDTKGPLPSGPPKIKLTVRKLSDRAGKSIAHSLMTAESGQTNNVSLESDNEKSQAVFKIHRHKPNTPLGGSKFEASMDCTYQ
jgi:hypothetical protein